jgi:DNA-directed RNA polymerase specialized sigma24 family protein
MDDDPLASLTPEEAFAMQSQPDGREIWLREHGFSRPPPGFFGRVAALAFEGELARDQAEKTAAQKARLTHANRRRPDLERLAYMMEDLRHRSPQRLVEVFVLCVEQGMSNAAAAEKLGISTSTVRTHLARLRAIMRRNLHVKYRPRAELLEIARLQAQ